MFLSGDMDYLKIYYELIIQRPDTTCYIYYEVCKTLK